MSSSDKGIFPSLSLHIGYICCIITAFLWIYYENEANESNKKDFKYSIMGTSITAFLTLLLGYYFISFHSDTYQIPGLHMHIAYISFFINIILYYNYMKETDVENKKNWKTIITVTTTITLQSVIFIGVLYYMSEASS